MKVRLPERFAGCEARYLGQLDGYIGDEKLPVPYRGYLLLPPFGKAGRPLFVIFQAEEDEWRFAAEPWNPDTISDHLGKTRDKDMDALYLDEGQAWYVKGMTAMLPRIKAELLRFHRNGAATMLTERDNTILSCEAIHLGTNPQGLRLEASLTGDWGIFQEIRISAFKGDGCVGDVLVGLNDKGELRVLVTTDGDGDEEHPVAVFPQRRLDEAVETDTISPRPAYHEFPKN